MATIQERLIQVAKETEGVYSFSVADLESPEWGAGGKCHNWRNHVSEDIVALWPLLPIEAKLVAFIVASRDADREEWD